MVNKDEYITVSLRCGCGSQNVITTSAHAPLLLTSLLARPMPRFCIFVFCVLYIVRRF